MSETTYYLPKELVKIIETCKSENFGLTLSKYVPFAREKGETKAKPKLKTVVEKYGKIQLGVPDKAIDLYRQYLNSVKIQDAVEFKMKTKSRLIVGLGQESVYETSIRLHRNYGVPIIPGSALKGIAKHYAVEKLAETNWKLLVSRFENEFATLKLEKDVYGSMGLIRHALDKSKKLLEVLKGLKAKLDSGDLITVEEVAEIFGTLEQEGRVIFFDALPEPNNLQDVFELDIMNSHYQPYYSGSEPPGDWFDPNPIFFLTIREGVVFNFWIWQKSEHYSNLLKKTKILLIEALKEVGVGAKTSLGYGRFEELK